MARVKLERDATIETVISTLRKPEDYVCGVLEKLHACRKDYGTAAVRIGITGRGVAPYYRIVHGAQAGSPDRDDQIYGAFYDNHRPLEAQTSSEMNGHWSSRFMTLEDVQDLRGRLPKARK